MTTVRLALAGSKHERLTLAETSEYKPAVLVSYFYSKAFIKYRDTMFFRDWVMDSGAFSAHTIGSNIDLGEYIDACHKFKENDPLLTEIFSLDVIGDHNTSMRNWQKMIDSGLDAIPTVHFGAPRSIVEEFVGVRKVALGGMVGVGTNACLRWAEQCFSVLWPKRIHGFGMVRKNVVFRLPFHSVDSSTWAFGPAAFGRWTSRPGLSVTKGETLPLCGEVEWYLRLENQLKARWKKELSLLELQK